ncbi:GNAT family N-acetyltransferase [Lewinellaceae bacterium SD302]|nr:GNAT family N-acetyltransferase [Lewinellaceae bacterium SD302]
MFIIREIIKSDNEFIAEIIRKVMPEFNCVGEGFSINDPEVDTMFEAYTNNDRKFYVIARQSDNKILGCGGFAPLPGGAHPEICELQKMYFYSELRGFGMGRKLLEKCIEEAQNLNYKKMYLETVTQMTDAAKLYTKMGFKYIPEQMGSTGHGGCDRFMLRDL